MNIDLSRKSICELRFDRTEASAEEALVASRVQTLTARHNRIDRIVGLGTLFHRLTHLDLAHNQLGRPTQHGEAVWGQGELPGAVPWLSALPPSLCVLNLSHNEIHSFADGPMRVGPFPPSNDPATLTQLRRVCPLTLSLFFSRAALPQLRELDLSHNALSLHLEASDGVEAVWHEAVEIPAASPSRTPHAMDWAAHTTSAVTHLRLDGNADLSALNGVLCGMSALTSLRASDCAVADLTAIAAAATACPNLCALNLSGCPVVDAFVHAPRQTLSKLVELLLLPPLEHTRSTEERMALHHAVRDVAHSRLTEVEAAMRQMRLPHALYAALLQQVLPQVEELDGDVRVGAAHVELMEAAREVMQRAAAEEEQLARLQQPRRSSPVTKKRLGGLRPPTKSPEEGSLTHPRATRRSGGSPRDGLAEGRGRRNPGEAPWSARGEVMATAVSVAASAAVAAAAQLRPLVRITSSSQEDKASTPGKEPCVPPQKLHRQEEQKGYREWKGTAQEDGEEEEEEEEEKEEERLRVGKMINGKALRRVMIHNEAHGNSNTSVSPNCNVKNNSSESCKHIGQSDGQFQKALAALTPLLRQRLDAVRTPQFQAMEATSNSTNITSSSANRTSISAVTTIEAAELANTTSLANHTITSTSATTTTTTTTTREALTQRACALESALLASQERQRELQESVSQLREQLQQDRRLITDQRKEAQRLRLERDSLALSNRQSRRKLQKRQKEIAYGATALQRREAVARRAAALRHVEREEATLLQMERAARGRILREAQSMQVHPARKTRADVLREQAVRERMSAMRQGDPLTYNPRRFRQAEGTLLLMCDTDGGGGDVDVVEEMNTDMNEEMGQGRGGRTPAMHAARHMDPTHTTSSHVMTGYWEGHRQEPFELTGDERVSANGGNGRVHGKTPWQGFHTNRPLHPPQPHRTVSPSTSRAQTHTAHSMHSPTGVMYPNHHPQQHGMNGYTMKTDDTGVYNDVDGVDEGNLLLPGERSLYEMGHSPYSNDVPTETQHWDPQQQQQQLQTLSLQQLFNEAALIRQRQHVLQQRMREVGGGRTTASSEERNEEVESERLGPASYITADTSSCGGTQERSNGMESCRMNPTMGTRFEMKREDMEGHDGTLRDTRMDQTMDTTMEDDSDSVDVDIMLAVGNDFTNVDPRPYVPASRPQQPQKGNTLCQMAEQEKGESFTADARGIYAEILRQQMQQTHLNSLEEPSPVHTVEVGDEADISEEVSAIERVGLSATEEDERKGKTRKEEEKPHLVSIHEHESVKEVENNALVCTRRTLFA